MQPKYPPTDELIQKMWCIHTHTHTHNGILLSHKKNKALKHSTTWNNLESVILSKNPDSKGHILHNSIHVEGP